MEQRKDTKWKAIRKDINEVATVLSQLSRAALMLDADLRSMRNELTEAGHLKPLEVENEQPEEAKAEDYFPAETVVGEPDQIEIANPSIEDAQGS